MRRAALVCLAAVSLGVGAACYPGNIEGVGELDLVFTVFDSAADFESIGTYAMPDTIVHIDDFGGQNAANGAVDPLILSAIAAEFEALGYTRLAADATTGPDVVIFVTAARSSLSYWVGAGWWEYWGWYPGWASWYPGWGTGYGPGYPWASDYVGTQSPGTLVVTMLDPGGAANQEIPAVWVGAVNGLFEGSDAGILARFEGLIRQVFDQSPYL